MHRRFLTCAAACALALAAPAAAADATFDRKAGDLILHDFHGRPIWELQAMCAGFHRATAAYWTGKARPDRARKAKVSSAQATNRVVVQLRRDRQITDRNEAVRFAAASEQVGWRVTGRALAKDGTDEDGQWSFWRSACDEVDRAFFAQTGG
ncbi:MAG TPA: hypothetical protein VEA15_10225 [Caulobacteraceae bacterium]|nr:hypothetical protein [Caulobacteraceae bacterium]